MKKPEVKNAIFGLLQGVLEETGFRLKKSEDAFVRKYDGGRDVLGIPLWDYNPEFEYSLNICIRVDAVEDIFNRFSGVQPKYHSTTFTTVTPLQYFTGDTARLKVASVPDVSNSIGSLSGVIHAKIIPFYDMLHDIQALDRAVNTQVPSIDITQYPAGAMHAVVIAYLAHNTDYDRIVVKHRADMQLSPVESHPFNSLVDFLKTH